MIFGEDKLRAGAGGGSPVGHSVGDWAGLEPGQEVLRKGKKREEKERRKRILNGVSSSSFPPLYHCC